MGWGRHSVLYNVVPQHRTGKIVEFRTSGCRCKDHFSDSPSLCIDDPVQIRAGKTPSIIYRQGIWLNAGKETSGMFSPFSRGSSPIAQLSIYQWLLVRLSSRLCGALSSSHSTQSVFEMVSDPCRLLRALVPSAFVKSASRFPASPTKISHPELRSQLNFLFRHGLNSVE